MQKRTGVFHLALLGGGVFGVLALAAFVQQAAAQYPDASKGPGRSVTVRGSVSQTVDRLTKMVADNGMMVMGELHQGKVLAMTGLRVESETIFVGSPTVGKKIFSVEPGAGLVVPVRINIYKDANGKTVVRYIPPSREMEAFGNAKASKICQVLDGKLQNMVSMLPK